MMPSVYVFALALVSSVCHAQEPNAMPWKTNTPIVDVHREPYEKHPRPKAAVCVMVRYMALD